MELHIFEDKDILIETCTKFICSHVQRSIEAQGYCNLVLAGGNSPRPLYERLAAKPYKDRVDWSKVFFFFGDERYVEVDSADLNSHMAEQTLFQPLNIPQENIFKVDTSLSVEEAAADYMRTIETHFQFHKICFDLILLGLGEDAHTASLFPFTKVLYDSEATVRSLYLEQKNLYRITMTAPLINQASHILFVTYGKNKAEAVNMVIKGKKDAEKYPGQLIKPEAGELHWFLDAAAAIRISMDH